MTIIVCTAFYIYVILSVNHYRREIEMRRNDGFIITGRIKAPYPVRIAVLLSLVALSVNIFLFVVIGNENTILINTLPALFFVNLLWRYERKIKRIDRENI